MHDWTELARLRDGGDFLFSNGGWNRDAYPDLQPLDAGTAITVASFEGPAVATHFHCVNHAVPAGADGNPLDTAHTRRGYCTRGVVLEVYYNGSAEPSVRVPLSDFFADGCMGKAEPFSSLCVEKAPWSYNCFLPMPFERSLRLVLRNDSPYDMHNYSFVEGRRLSRWDSSLGYLHAAWRRMAFQLTPDSDVQLHRVEGHGHLVGRAWSIITDEPLFEGFHFVMEGNNEVFVDGAAVPRADYLGSEDSFGFSWGWPRLHAGVWNGINYVRHELPAEVSTYRFADANAIPFGRSLEWRVDWSHEFPGSPWLNVLRDRNASGGGWVDYATTHYWYQETVGYKHGPEMPLAERILPLLRTNPPLEYSQGSSGARLRAP